MDLNPDNPHVVSWSDPQRLQPPGFLIPEALIPSNQVGRLLAALVACLLLTAASTALGQEPAQSLTIAFYAPSVYFENSVARAGFIDNLASRLETELSLRVQGQNLSNPDALTDADLAIVDGPYFASNRIGTPLASAEASFGTSGPLALLVSSSGPRRLSELRGRTLILPRGCPRLVDFITGTVLVGEISAEAFFGGIEYTANFESALSAVEQGRADATLGFADQAGASGLRTLDSYGVAPMPVVVAIAEGIDPALVERIGEVIRSYRGDQSIRGFSSYDSTSVSRFQTGCSTNAPQRTMLMTRPGMVTMEGWEIDLPTAVEPFPLTPPAVLLVVPPLEEP
ncbi:MAG: hypothetical protein JW797_12390 [Bradymonadales bacterium]|nr:hypothetical protein [Bradymonadales bacterium]